MIIAGAQCDLCGRIDDIKYNSSETAIKVILGQKGWVFQSTQAICPFCNASKQNQQNQKN